PAL
ncbi:hypothetical protein BVZ35_00008B, partial [Haemophilus influenzae]